jgi:hypothetical protein
VQRSSGATPFTLDFLQELLAYARFRSISRCDYGVTRSPYPALASLDNRARASIFVEAVK